MKRKVNIIFQTLPTNNLLSYICKSPPPSFSLGVNRVNCDRVLALLSNILSNLYVLCNAHYYFCLFYFKE